MKKIIAFTLCMLLLSLCSCTDTTPSQTPVSEEEAPVNETFTATALRKMTWRIFSSESGEMTREDQYEYHYGEDGLRIGETYTGLGGLRGENEYEYDEKGRCIAYHRQRIGYDDWFYVTEYRYDEDGRMIYCMNPRGRETFYTYDEQGRLSEERSVVAGNEAPQDVLDYTYEEDGGFTSQFRYSFDGTDIDAKPMQTLVKRVDAAGKLVFEVVTNEYIDTLHHYTYEYDFDEKGRVTERRKLCEEYENAVAEMAKWTYDEEGRILSAVIGEMDVEQYSQHGEESVHTERIDVNYDAEGRLVRFVIRQKGPTYSTHWEYLYEYGEVTVGESLAGADLVEKEYGELCPNLKAYLPLEEVR